uniref:Uncharacterized protein n=1 Tax=Leersia perrieri TaxID=77586 RepID=A0A0D9XCH5_9ORYZ
MLAVVPHYRVITDSGFFCLYCSWNSLTIGNYFCLDPNYFNNWIQHFCSCEVSSGASVPLGLSLLPDMRDEHDCFSLTFLPEPNDNTSWVLVDSHGSILLVPEREREWGDASVYITVCEPSTRRYKTVVVVTLEDKEVICKGVFLVGAGGNKNDRVGVSNFYRGD